MEQDIGRRRGFRFEKNISLAAVLTLLVVSVGFIASYLRIEAQSAGNAQELIKIGNKIDSNREFQINQRTHVLSRVNGIQEESQNNKAALAAVTAKTDYIAKQVDRLVQNLIEGRAPR